MAIPAKINQEYDIIIAGGAYFYSTSLLSEPNIGQAALRGASSPVVLRRPTLIVASSSSRRVLRHTTTPHIRSPCATQPTSPQARAPYACTPADQVPRLGAAQRLCSADSVSAVGVASTVRLALLCSLNCCQKTMTDGGVLHLCVPY